jgi:hypothetical protein
MNQRLETYTDLYGREWNLASLDVDERAMIAELRQRADEELACTAAPMDRWNAFSNYWPSKVLPFYESRGMTRNEATQTPGFHLAQDLSGRIAVSLGLAREPDYRDSLQRIIHTQFASRRAFCDATGIAEDMLSHVLAGRKDLSLGSLAKAMHKIGYRLDIVPCEAAGPRTTGE